jgi:ubiquinone/menaquinone biosynthesis C-methylase UbiE
MGAGRWVLRLLLAVLFLAAGTMKLAANPEAVAAFEKVGFGQGFRVFVGVAEVAGALGLLVTPVAPVAALALALLMVGAIASHLTVLGGSPAPAILVFTLTLAVVWLERSALGVLGMLRTGKGPMDGWVARSYDRGVQAAFRDLFPSLVRDLLDQMAGVRRVLDAGCGPGQFTIVVAETLPDAEVWGIDLAPTMIEIAREHAAASRAAGRLRFEVADVTRLPFRDGEFDAVMSSGSIKHWPDPVAGLHELHRVLAPGGRAFIAEMNRAAPPEAVRAVAGRMGNWFFRRMYPRALSKALSPAEARVVFGASPFGSPVAERTLLDGCVWVFEVRKAGAPPERAPAAST